MRPVIKPAPVAGKSELAFKVSSQSKATEIGIQTLVGDYKREGENHDRPVYVKTQTIPGHEQVKVFMYYWDKREGVEFSGWWFGDAVGGSQVWARANQHGPTPPRVGWKIPWDADKVEPGALIVDPAGKPGAAAPAATAVKPAAGGLAAVPAATGPVNETVKNVAQQVADAKASADEVIARSRKEATAQAEEDVLRELSELHQQENSKLGETQKALTAALTQIRAGGAANPANVKAMQEVSQLSPKLKTIQASITAEFNKVKSLLAKLQAMGKAGKAPPMSAEKQAEAAAKKEELAAKQKETEEKDTAELQASLPASQELVKGCEDAAENVCSMANPLIDDPPDDDSDTLKNALEEIETGATDASAKVTDARKQINLQLQEARKYAPETRKAALAEYSSLQAKLTEAQKKINPYKSFKKEFKGRVEAKKSLQEITDKLGEAELEVEKASMMTSAGEMSEEDITSCEKLLQPANGMIQIAIRSIEQKSKTAATQAVRDELTVMREKCNVSKKKLDGVATVLRGQKETLSAQLILAGAREKVDFVEEVLLECSKAELPFMKGLEILPGEESSNAIKECEAAAAKAQQAGTQAVTYLNAKIAEVKKYSKDTAKTIGDELAEVKTRCDAAVKKVSEFRKETAERRTNAVLAEVVVGVTEVEEKAKGLAEAGAVFSSDDLEVVSNEALKEAGEKVTELEKVFATALMEARKQLGAKQKESKSPEMAAGLKKLMDRLTAAQNEVGKTKKAIANGDKLMKGKEVLTEEDAKITAAEEDITKADALASKTDDGLGDELTDEGVMDMIKMITGAQAVVKASQARITQQLAGAPPNLKASFEKLVERTKAGTEKLAAILTATKELRERASANAFVTEAKEKSTQLEATMEKVEETELPFLKGIELGTQETKDVLKEADAQIVAASKLISETKAFVAAKVAELKKFQEAIAKAANEELTQVQKAAVEALEKLTAFKKEMDVRRKACDLQDATEKVGELETKVEEFSKGVVPLEKKDKKSAAPVEKKEEKKEGEEAAEPAEAKEEAPEEPELSEEAANELAAKLAETSKEIQALLDSSRTLLAARQKDTTNTEAQKETLKGLTLKMTEASKVYIKAKHVTKAYEDKFTAQRLIAEAEEIAGGAEDAVKKATDEGAPLLEHGGKQFLTKAAADRLACHLQDEMKEKEWTHETVFDKMGASGGSLSREAFISYLEKLPEASGKPEMMFLEERRDGMFAMLDPVGGGTISLDNFKKELFGMQYKCLKALTLTDVLEIGKSKTTGKVEPGEMLEAIGAPQVDEETKMTRCEVRLVSSDKAGWATIAGNQGAVFLQAWTGFRAFTTDMEQKFVETAKPIQQAMTALQTKQAECAKAAGNVKGPLADAKLELGKIRARITTCHSNLEALKRKFVAAKAEQTKKELADKDAHIYVKEQKEADAISAEVNPKVDAMAECAKRLEEAVKPFSELAEADKASFATPASLQKEVNELLQAANASVVEARTAVKEAMTKVGAVMKGPLAEAKKTFAAQSNKCNSTQTANANFALTVKKGVKVIVDKLYSKVASGVRADLQAKGSTPAQLFDELAKGAEKVSEDSFCAHLASAAGLGDDLKPEHARLLCNFIDISGIGKRKFLGFLQQYYVVVKPIAITDEFGVDKAKTIRKADVDEVIEVIEGPRTDDELKMSRVRGKSLVDGLVGWIAIKGSQGTPFLKEVEKPYYACTKEIALDKEFAYDGSEPIRVLKDGEIIELVEGPKKQAIEPALRARGKASKGGETGWFTVKDHRGVYAEADSKLYNVVGTVAMTDDLDIKNCKVLRKLNEGELFTLLEGPTEDNGVSRVKATCAKDGKEGWITVKGNAGTVYAEPSVKIMQVVKETSLQKGFSSKLEAIRTLEVGESIEIIDKPKEEPIPPEVRVKGKAVEDGAVGWITLAAGCVRPWSPMYKCKVVTQIHDAITIEGASLVRDLVLNEVVELLEGPKREGTALRMRARAEKDGAVGWVTIKDGDGKQFLAF